MSCSPTLVITRASGPRRNACIWAPGASVGTVMLPSRPVSPASAPFTTTLASDNGVTTVGWFGESGQASACTWIVLS